MKTVNRREFVATAVAVGAGAMLRVPAFALENQSTGASSVATSKAVEHEVVVLQASPFPMKNVRLLPGTFSAAAEANRKYLKTLPPERLLHTFRLTAGLPSSAEPLGIGKSPIANCEGTSPAGITFRLARWRSPARETKNLSVTAISWLPNWLSARRSTKTAISARSRRSCLTACAME